MSYSVKYNEIFYAFVVDIGTNETLADIGLFEGKIRLVSDGKLLTGCTFEDGTAVSNPDKFENLLLKTGLNRAGSRINIQDGGDYAYLTNMDFTIVNKAKSGIAYHEALNNLQLEESWLVGSKVTFYVIINDVLYTRWVGVVSNTVFDDKEFRFSCQDRLITDFKEIPETDDGQFVFGSVPFIPLLKKDNINIGIFNCPFVGVDPVTHISEFAINEYSERFSYPGSTTGWYIGFTGYKESVLDPNEPHSWSKSNAFDVRLQRAFSPINSDLMVIRVLFQNGVDYDSWLNKTLTAGSEKSIILGIERSGDEVRLTCKAVVGLDGANFGKTRQFAGDNWISQADVVAEFNNSLEWNTDKIRLVISDEYTVYSLGENFNVNDIERDSDGNIVFYTIINDKYEQMKIDAIIDNDLNILISPNTTSTEYIGADEILIESMSDEKHGFEAQFDSDFNPIKNKYPTSGGKWIGDKLKKEYDLLDTTALSKSSITAHITNGKLRIVAKFKNFDEKDVSSVKPAIMARQANVQFYNIMKDESKNNFNVPGIDYTLDPGFTLPRGIMKATKPESYFVGGTGSTGVNSVRPHIPEGLTANIMNVEVYTMTHDAEYGILTNNNPGSPKGTASFRLPLSVHHGEVTYFEENTVNFPNPQLNQRIKHTHAPAMGMTSTNIPAEVMPDNSTVGETVQIRYPVSIKNFTGSSSFNAMVSWETTERTAPIKTRLARTTNFIQQYNNYSKKTTFDTLTFFEGYEPYSNEDISFGSQEISTEDLQASKVDGDLELCYDISLEQSHEFRAWVSTILPNVTDDSISWSVLLAKGIKRIPLQIFKIGLVVEKSINFDQLFIKKKKNVDINDDETNTVAGTIDYIVKDYSGIDYNAGNLSETRGNTEVIWNVGHVIKQRQNTFSVLTELLKQSFVAGYTNRFGKPTFTAWRDTDEFDTIIHDNSIIIRNSIKNFALTPLTNVYNNLKVDFAYDYGLNEYMKSYSVNFIDIYSAFPQYDDELQSLADINSTPNFWNGVIRKYDDEHYAITMPGRPEVLDYLKVGGTLVFPEMFGRGISSDKQLILKNCYITETISDPATLVQDIIFTCDVIVDDTASGASLNTYYTEIKYSDSIILDWKTFVTGMNDYDSAKIIWENCRAGYLQTRTINQMPEDRSKLIWASDLESVGEQPRQYDEYAYQYLLNSSSWNTVQKFVCEYQVPITSDTVKLELMKKIHFTDPILTPQIENKIQYGIGWIVNLSLDATKNIINVTLLFEKFGTRIPSIIDDRCPVVTETSRGTDIIITETNDVEDIIINEGCDK
jgi:hypothetical protein